MTKLKSTLAALLGLGLVAAGTANAAGIFKDPENWLDRHGHCFWCHDSRTEMRNWLEENREYEAKNRTLAPLIHANHRRSSKDLATCTNCHGDGPTAHWKTDVERETCIGCHEVDTVTNHKTYKNEDCKACHTPESIREVHVGESEKVEKARLRDLAAVKVTDAKLVRDKGLAHIEVTFEIRDGKGEAVDAKGDPAKLDWIEELIIYTNWGVKNGFVAPRGFPLYVKSTFKDIRQQGDELTPFGERARAKLFSQNGNRYTYRTTGFELPAGAEQSDELGLLMTSFTYCLDAEWKLGSCAVPGALKNAAWATHEYFGSTGLTEKPSDLPREVAPNRKCAFCHDYDVATDNTKLRCGCCHSEDTKIAGVLSSGRHFAGNDGEMPTKLRDNGIHAAPFFYNPNTDVEGCVICHNESNMPTSGIREKRIDPRDPHYVDELLVSHPAWNVFVHAVHDNARPGAEDKDDVRHVSYVPHTSSCTKCHMSGTFDPKRLQKDGKPLAIDTEYSAESKAYPAVSDAKARLWASPVAATCYACHAKTVNEKGETVWNEKAKSHITQMGGALAVEKSKVKTENCAVCHTAEQLTTAHRIKENGYWSKLPMHPSFVDRMPIQPGQSE